jgi:signal transduction histidine kinase
MQELVSGPISGPTIVHDYDRQRRMGLARVITLWLTILLSLYTVVFTIYLKRIGVPQTHTVLAVLTDGALVACIGLFVLASYGARHEQLVLATWSTIAGTAMVIVSFNIFWAFLLGNGLDPVIFGNFASTGIVIALAGVLGESWMIVVTTIAMNLYVLVALHFAAPISPPGLSPTKWQPLLARDLFVFGSTVIIAQWAFAITMLASSASYRRTLGDIGSAYLQIRQLDQLDQLKDQFITNVNHELRNPAMALQGYVELLRLRHEVITPERRGQLIERAARAGDDLVALLTSVLETRRLDSSVQQFTPEAVNVRAAVEDAVRLIDPREANALERELHIAIPEGMAIWGEKVRLRQILTNLLSNAVKYSPPDLPVEVAARHVLEVPQGKILPWRAAAGKPRQMVEISVRDYGLGIPPDQIPLLFKRFVRLPRDLASNVVGNGLGLHLCRVLAEAMDGTIWVESTGIEGSGSTFFVRLPTPSSLGASHSANEAPGAEVGPTHTAEV